ncbi:MAG: hypothetical protein JXC85_00135, partial [Candidatus Aenigmarchaeota archaeon]|nr:hypothetical protein [Candidatus Aenigmarchaeota archaeon]
MTKHEEAAPEPSKEPDDKKGRARAAKEKPLEEKQKQPEESETGSQEAEGSSVSGEEKEAETVEDVVAKVRGEAVQAGTEGAKEEPSTGWDRRKGRKPFGEKEEEWIPKTKLGNDVLAGRFKTLDEILEKGDLILEPEIIDALIPDLMQEIIYIGGSPGKGGGIRRTATKMTARMHKSGRRFKLSAVAVVGNGNGIVGVGSAISKEHRTALEKAVKNAKLNTIRVRRGCGSWECGCG